jgi:CRP/FNR family transcriptional regulator, nitrogen fixation regulation protein
MLRLRGHHPTATAEPVGKTSSEIQSHGTFLKFLKGEIVYDQGDPATHWYEVISGTVRTCFLYSSGHRQLTGFFYAGDVFGIELGTHQSSAEAVTNLVLRRIDRSCQPEETASRHTPEHAVTQKSVPVTPGAATTALSTGALESALSNAQACIFLLGHRTAPERMAAFLLATSRRMGLDKAVKLPMSRADIADHLGLTIHTVSRTLSDFVRRDLITLEGPQSVHILDRHALMRMAGRTPEDSEIPRSRPFIPPPANQNLSGLEANARHSQSVFTAIPRN